MTRAERRQTVAKSQAGFSKRMVAGTNIIHYSLSCCLMLCLLSTGTIWKGQKLALDPCSQNSFSVHFIPSGSIHNIQPFWYINHFNMKYVILSMVEYYRMGIQLD